MKHSLPLAALLLAAICAYADPLGAATLCDGKWYNDEYSFQFSADGVFRAFYTQGAQIGTLHGTWLPGEDSSRVSLRASSVEEAFPIRSFPDVFELEYATDPANPKATASLQGLGGKLVLWSERSFVKAGASVAVAPSSVPGMAMGYRLTATTDNLRLRKGPGTDHEYMVYTYIDAKTGETKTFTSVFAGTNLRILARTMEKAKVGDWYNYWYYVEYKEPLEGWIVYRNAWMFGEFLNVAENKARAIRIDGPENEGAYYGAYEMSVFGSVTGAPVRLSIQIKGSLGAPLSTRPVDEYDQVRGTFRAEVSKDEETLFIGANTVNIVATYSDGKTASKQISFYVHEGGGAERAKPVVYLYPERDMEISVKVSPPGGVTVSEPAYGTGWRVLARPDGSLKELSSGKSYPYLFWESSEGKRPTTKSGFVVASAELPAFFREKLAILGLNAVETGDFLEFWIPVLDAAPWYYISFIDQAVQDAEAPLVVTPRPDSVIRVFFDSLPLAAPVPVVGQTLLPRARRGFAVVEWGGMRYRD